MYLDYALLLLLSFLVYFLLSCRGPQWLRGQCAHRVIAEAKQLSQRAVIGWVTKIYHLELIYASEGK
jgi:hypothetical protein